MNENNKNTVPIVMKVNKQAASIQQSALLINGDVMTTLQIVKIFIRHDTLMLRGREQTFESNILVSWKF